MLLLAHTTRSERLGIPGRGPITSMADWERALVSGNTSAGGMRVCMLSHSQVLQTATDEVDTFVASAEAGHDASPVRGVVNRRAEHSPLRQPSPPRSPVRGAVKRSAEHSPPRERSPQQRYGQQQAPRRMIVCYNCNGVLCGVCLCEV